MTVYIEYVLIDNFIIDYLILKATFALTGLSVRRGRLLFCSFLGASFALLYPLLNSSVIILTLIKLGFGLFLVAVASRYKTIKSYYVNAIAFFGLTFLTGGAVIGLYNIFNIPLGTDSTVALAIIPIYLIVKGGQKVIKHFYRRKETDCFIRKVELVILGEVISANGFYDSGNGVYDGESPVIFCDKRFARRIIEKSPTRKIKTLEINTVNGKSRSPSFKIDAIKIYNGKNYNIYNNVTLCVCACVGDNYDVILHPALNGGYYEKLDIQTEKIS